VLFQNNLSLTKLKVLAFESPENLAQTRLGLWTLTSFLFFLGGGGWNSLFTCYNFFFLNFEL